MPEMERPRLYKVSLQSGGIGSSSQERVESGSLVLWRMT